MSTTIIEFPYGKPSPQWPAIHMAVRRAVLALHALHVSMLGESDKVGCFVWYCNNRLDEHIQLCLEDIQLYRKITWCLSAPNKSTEQMEMIQSVMCDFEEKLGGKPYSMLSQWPALHTDIKHSLVHVRCVYMRSVHPYDNMRSFEWYLDNKLDQHIQLCMQDRELYLMVLRSMCFKPNGDAHKKAAVTIALYLENTYNEFFVSVVWV